MAKRQQLPLGTVVKIQGLNRNLMVISQFPLTEIDGQKGYFDFGGTVLPVGLTDKKVIFFNREDVEEVVFLGYVDIVFQDFLNKYDEILSDIPYEKLSIERKGE